MRDRRMSRHRNVRSRAFSYDDDYGDYDDYDDYYEEQQYQPQQASLGAYFEQPQQQQQSAAGRIDEDVIQSLVDHITEQLQSASFTPSKDRVREMLSMYDYDPDRTLAYFQQQVTAVRPKTKPSTPSHKQPASSKPSTPSKPSAQAAGKGKEGKGKQKPGTPQAKAAATATAAAAAPAPSAEAKVEAKAEANGAAEDVVSDDELTDIAPHSEHEKPSLSAVVVGHVDAGKSTLMGQLLLKLGVVSDHQARKYQQSAQGSGKGSFYLAWIMDENEAERQHGVTIDVARRSFETPHRHINLLDAPGHRDFIPNMIDGVSSADVSILVVPAAPNEYETAMGESAQTREHAILLRSLGIKQVVVAVNKIDSTNPPYDKARYDAICDDVLRFMQRVGFNSKHVRFVPVSAYNGDNVTSLDPGCPLAAWYGGPTLVEAIDTFRVPPQEERKPPRAIVTESIQVGDRTAEVMLRVIQGNLRVNRSYRIFPMKHVVRIASIEVGSKSVNAVAARTEARVVLRFVSGKAAGDGITAIEIGSVLAKGPTFPRTVVSFTAMVTCVPSITSPFMPGYFDLHIHGARVECAVTKLLRTVDPQTGDTIRKSPQFVTANSSAVVQIATRDEVTIEDFSACPALGRFVLRDEGRTIAVGKIQSSKPKAATAAAASVSSQAKK